MAKLVSKVYGDALFSLATTENKVDELLPEARGVVTLLDENKDLIRLLNHPKIVKEEKVKIIEDTFRGRVSDEVTGLLRLLVEKGHSEEIPKVLDYFIDQIKEYKNIGTAYVTSAVTLSDSQKEAVKKRLLETTGYVTFEMNYDVDPSLIGGMKIRIKDRVVDSSIKTKIYELKKELSQIQVSNI